MVEYRDMRNQVFFLNSDPVIVFSSIKMFDGTDPDFDDLSNFIVSIAKDDPANTTLVTYDYSVEPDQFTLTNSTNRIDIQADLDDLGTITKSYYFANLYLVDDDGYVTATQTIRLMAKGSVSYGTSSSGS